MRYRAWTVRSAALAAGITLVAAIAASPALAAGNGLPRTYQAQRVDSPQPQTAGLFSLSLQLAGDLDRDGREDLISPQVAGFNSPGQVYAFSGATGALIDTIPAPDAGGAGANAQFGLLGTGKVGVRTTAGTFSDLGSCAGGRSGQTCPENPIGRPDGVPELLIGATGVDVGGVVDVGRVYVIDGATRAVLKRIDMPPADRALTGPGAGFGREVLAPEGLTPCEGNAGIGPCDATIPPAVQIGDMDGGGRPDIVVGARRFNETPDTAQVGSHCRRATMTPGATCRAAGRAYVYRGEDIFEKNPAEILDGSGGGQVVRTIKNPDAQADDTTSSTNTDAEGFGNDLIQIGDVGTCREIPATGTAPAVPVPPAGARCPRAQSVTTPDGRPEVVIPAPGADYPLNDPDQTLSEVGAAYLVDGATGTILHTFLHPEPQRGAGFGGTFEHTLAPGDMGDTGLPDIVLGAPGQNAGFTAAGRAYVMTGAFKSSASRLNIARLNDPTPDVTEENFGGSSAGVGDLVPGAENPANELLVGQSGPRIGPFVEAARPLDVVFFNPSTERALQTVPDPDAQTSSAFGDSIEPLGDLNGDGFLDFAVGAFRFRISDALPEAGRFYIFRSDNSPAPATAPPPAPPAATTTVVAPLVGRALELTARPRAVRRGRAVTLSGVLEAFADGGACVAGQEVQLQRRQPGETRFTTFARVRAAADGGFTSSDRPTRSVRYRALATQTSGCLGTVSGDVAVTLAREVSLVTRSTTLRANRVLVIQLRCPATGGSICQGTVKLRTAQRVRRPGGGRARLTLGTRPFQIPAGRRRTTRIPLTSATARALRALRQVRITAFITNRDTDGGPVASRGTFTLRTR